MGFRFRKSIKIAPGVKINLGGKSASVTVGKKGASVNVSNRGVRGTVGIPGTGISYSDDIIKRSRQKNTVRASDGKSKSLAKTIFILILFFMIVGVFFVPSN